MENCCAYVLIMRVQTGKVLDVDNVSMDLTTLKLFAANKILHVLAVLPKCNCTIAVSL